MRREAGSLESAVVAVVAAADSPLSVAQVRHRLPTELAYTTVMTTLARMVDKGALIRVKDGRAFRYQLAAPQGHVDEAVTARRMHRLLDDGADRAGVLARFVAELGPDEERMLADLLDRTTQQDRGTGAGS